MLSSLFAIAFGYIAGSIPSGVIVTRLAGAEDPRNIGSKNIGATNVLRTGRKDLAALTLVADALKGTFAVLGAAHFDTAATPHLGLLAAVGAFFGHLFPLFLGFKGGKGVATFFGCLVGVAWPAALVFAIIWTSLVVLTRYSSVAALSASAVSPVVLALIGRHETALVFAALALVLWWKHAANIKRLVAGTESKVGGRKPGGAA